MKKKGINIIKLNFKENKTTDLNIHYIIMNFMFH